MYIYLFIIIFILIYIYIYIYLEWELKPPVRNSAKIQFHLSDQEMLHLPGDCAFQQKCNRDQRASQHNLRDIMVIWRAISSQWDPILYHFYLGESYPSHKKVRPNS